MHKGRPLRILITAGPTREYFDSVRFISNPSSGKMGFALAAEGAKRGHDVTLVSGPVVIEAPRHVRLIEVDSAAEMFDASAAAFENSDAAILTAAVCDYRPARRLDHKLKKKAQPRRVTLLPTRDIAAHLGRIKGSRVTIGFAMEDRDGRRNAERKLKVKRCDAIVLNGKENVGSQDATIEILTSDGRWYGSQSGSKRALASVILSLTEELAARRRFIE